MCALRFAAVVEATTLLILLLVAVPAKYLLGYAEGVRWLGPVHGLAFIAFVSVVASAWASGSIAAAGVIRLLVGAVIPFGGFVNERWLREAIER